MSSPAGPCPQASSSKRRFPSERWFLARRQEVVIDACGERVVFFLEPSKLSFQVTHALLQAAHFGDHAQIWTADVAENSLRHGRRSSTLSDQSGHTHEHAKYARKGARRVVVLGSH